MSAMAFVTQPESDDARAVRAAAAALRISEYDLFRLAFEQWSGRTARDDDLEPVFVAFLFDHGMPAWARHFARTVLDRLEAGTLDRDAMGAARYRRVVPIPARVRPTLAASVLLIVVYALGATAIHFRREIKDEICGILAAGGLPAVVAAALVEGKGAVCGGRVSRPEGPEDARR
jgi:hypothetical protein